MEGGEEAVGRKRVQWVLVFFCCVGCGYYKQK